MSRKIDWANTYKTPLRGLRTPKGASYGSRKEQVAQAFEQMAKAEAEQARFQRLEPLLRKALLEHLVGRKPITVIQPLTYVTEGLEKAEDQDEIDRAFYRQPQNSERIPQFKILHKTLPPGTVLTFHRLDPQLGQWIFKSSTGGEVEIYDASTIMLTPDRVSQNPGFWGLLTATSIYVEVVGSDDEP